MRTQSYQAVSLYMNKSIPSPSHLAFCGFFILEMFKIHVQAQINPIPSSELFSQTLDKWTDWIWTGLKGCLNYESLSFFSVFSCLVTLTVGLQFPNASASLLHSSNRQQSVCCSRACVNRTVMTVRLRLDSVATLGRLLQRSLSCLHVLSTVRLTTSCSKY